jgi:hypothetical protein
MAASCPVGKLLSHFQTGIFTNKKKSPIDMAKQIFLLPIFFLHPPRCFL